MLRLAGCALVALCSYAAVGFADHPTYAQVASSPAAHAQTNPLTFYLPYEGLRDVDATFATLGRTSATHVQVIEPPGGRLPMFVAMSSGLVRMLREYPTGTTYRVSGRLRYFKRPQYDETSFKNMSLNLQKQTKNLDEYYKLSATGPEAAGHSVHYIIDITSVQKLSKSELAKHGGGSEDAPREATGYQQVALAKLAQLAPPTASADARGPGRPETPVAGIPVRLTLPYVGLLGGVDGAPGLAALAESAMAPKETVVSETDVPRADPQLQLLKPPGPLSRLVVIAYGKDWDLAKELEGMRDGDSMVVTGVLKRAPTGVDARLLLVLESVEKAAGRTGPPGPPEGGPPGPPR